MFSRKIKFQVDFGMFLALSIFSPSKLVLINYSKLTRWNTSKLVILRCREKNIQLHTTKVPPIDAEFWDKSNGGTFVQKFWKYEELLQKNLIFEGDSFFLHYPVKYRDFKFFYLKVYFSSGSVM